MALKPPIRGGSNSGIGRGIDRRGGRLSELFFRQSSGSAAQSVLADHLLASGVAGEGKSGTVTGALPTFSGAAAGSAQRKGTATGAVALTGTITSADKGAAGTAAGVLALSGTVAGRRATTGAVTGSLVLTGTTAGARGATGAVAGTLTLTGTADGTEGRTVAVAGQITLDGTVTGTGSVTGDLEPSAPPLGGARFAGFAIPILVRPRGRRVRGTVTGSLALTGSAHGARASTGTIRAHLDAHAVVRGHRGASGRLAARVAVDAWAWGRRRLRPAFNDDAEVARILGIVDLEPPDRRAADDAEVARILGIVDLGGAREPLPTRQLDLV